jgi:formyl-CoA transferase
MPALDGVRVLDMTQYEAGTSCTQYLGWLGADVVKVEGPNGDPGRQTGRQTRYAGDSQYFMNYNANKRSVVIDLKQPEGRELLLELASHFDVFVENYGPGVIESLDIGYEVMRERNPGIIYARIKGFGLSGPYSQYNVYDWVAQASAGTFSVTGDPDGPPMHPGPSFADSGTGVQAALGILAAYVQRQRTGQGQLIEASMQEAVTMFMRTLGLATWGEAPAPRQGISHGGAVTSTYPCKGGGSNDWVFIMVVTTRMYDALCAATGIPELVNDERFATPEARLEHKQELYEVIADWTRQRDKREVMGILGPAGVPCSYVFDTLDLFTDPHLQERELVHTVEHPVNGEVRLMRMPLLLSDSQVPLRPSPLLGQHTAEVLARDLHYDAERLGRLQAAGVIRCAE